MRSFRITFYSNGCFYSMNIGAPNEAIAWLRGLKSMVVYGHAANKRHAWAMKVVCLENLSVQPIKPSWENPNYNPKAKRTFCD
jgi:hypothetical protein